MIRYAHIMVGPPGSGKSTLAKAIAAQLHDPVLLSLDTIREEVYGDANIQGGSEIFEIFAMRLLKATYDYKNIVIDNTSVKARNRRDILKLLPNYYTVIYEVLLTPVSECLRRNSSRNRVVPEDVIIRMSKTLQENLPLLMQEKPQKNFHINGQVYIDYLPEDY